MSILQIRNDRGPLKVSGNNARYFTDNSGKALFLAGFHTWYNVQDGGTDSPPTAFDWDAYLAAIRSNGCNFIRLWTLENSRWWPSDNTQIFYPPRYERTGPGDANDGGLKFDLTQVNQEFLSRLYSRVAECQSKGIYCGVMLFNGFSVDSKGDTYEPSTHHPYLAANNINELDGDFNDDGSLLETQTDTNNAAWSYQQDFVEAVIDTLNDLDNVIWELCNEPTGSAAQDAWCDDLIDHITTYEATKPKQHPIWYSVAYPSGSNTNLDGSAADCVSYNADKADTVVDGTKVSLYDTDHTNGGTTDYSWIWEALCNGHGGVLAMDVWDSANPGTPDATYATERANLGYALARVNGCTNFLQMTPQPSLSTTGYCLALDQAAGAEYIVFQGGTGAFDLDLTNASGTLSILWVRCSDGDLWGDASTTGGDVRTLTPPWAGEVVAYVYN